MPSPSFTVDRSFHELLRKGSLGSSPAQKLSARTDPAWAEAVLWDIAALDNLDKAAEYLPAPSPGTRARAKWQPSAESQPNDAELVRRALGDAEGGTRAAALEAIADRYLSLVLRQCSLWFPDFEDAQDVTQAAFEAAFTLLLEGRGPNRPDKLAGWLIEIARLRGREHLRRRSMPSGVGRAFFPDERGYDDLTDTEESRGHDGPPQDFDDLAYDEESRSGSAVRRAHAVRLVDMVVATLTPRQQQTYELRFVEGLTGREIAWRLGISEKTASNQITRVRELVATGFGALILYQEGRPYCPDLARIVDRVEDTPGGDSSFTTAMREKIVNHFADHNLGDDCRTCNARRRELSGPYAP